MQAEAPLTRIPLPAPSGERRAKTHLSRIAFGDSATVPPKGFPLPLERERVRVRVRLDCMDTPGDGAAGDVDERGDGVLGSWFCRWPNTSFQYAIEMRLIYE